MVDWNPQANEIFVRAAEMESSEKRAAFLAAQCGHDAELRRQVDSLLAASEQAGDVLKQPAAPTRPSVEVTAAHRPVREGTGTTIGPYKLLQEIGEGGFGTVFMAEQQQPVRRMVAIKVIKPGMDTEQVVARFESERQALAIMDHPHIAKVFDAGATDTGRPYFVMELVKGVPITEFSDKNHMPAHQRLKLFIDVCHAIQHAHHKGIIHRDIKPSNVLVTLHDGTPVVKVIDFGVAKATVQKLTERTMFTAYGQMIGTPAYMSPEQAEMSGLDIDTRSDIYSLGVLLYELLTGTTPLEMKRLREAGYAEMQRMIREEEAPRPSTRLSSLGDSATVLASNRGTDPKQLARLLSGDLDWVVMKSLEKDRNRRYGTPGIFAEDIERYLRHEAIEARPPSAGYRLRKFARRHRMAVLTGGTVAAALVIGTVLATWQAVRATRAESAALAALADKEQARREEAEQRQRAEDNERKAIAAAEAEKTARETAEAREAETKAVLDFVENKVFAAARPEGQDGGLGHDVTLRKAIEFSLPFIEQSFMDQPLIETRLRVTIGSSFMYLGEPELARQQYERAVALRKATLGPDHRDTLASMANLATSYVRLGRSAEALALHEETLALRKTTLGPDHPDTLESMHNLANSYEARGRYAEGLMFKEETLALSQARLGREHPDTLRYTTSLAMVYNVLGRNDDMLKLLEEAVPIMQARLPNHSETLLCATLLAHVYEGRGQHAEALQLRQKIPEPQQSKLDPDDPNMLESTTKRAYNYLILDRHDEAIKLYEETVALGTAKFGPDHPDTIMLKCRLMFLYASVGRHTEVLTLSEEVLTLCRAKLGPDHPTTLLVLRNLPVSFSALSRHDEALKVLEETLAILKAKADPDPPMLASTMDALAWMLVTVPDVQLRDTQRAVVLAAGASASEPNNPIYLGTLGAARYRAGDWPAAIADLDKAIGLHSPLNCANAVSGFFLAMAHWQLGEQEKAREWFNKSVGWMEMEKQDNPELTRFRTEAAELLGISGNGSEDQG